MRPTEAVGERPSAQKISLAVLILAATVSIPYLFPAPLAISRAYITGFNNRVAVIVLLVGTGLFAAFTKGRVARSEKTDSRLSWRVLLFALLCTLVSCLRYTGVKAVVLPGAEASYFLNRLQMLAAGLTPYRQFEFMYGPLLLYPILWVQKLLHLSAVQAFVITWLAFWQVGVIMIWSVVRSIDLPISSRRTAFGFLVAAQLVWAGYGGINYTPLRAYVATFCICLTCRMWTRYESPWLVAFCSIASVALTICCSIDQAVAVVCGLAFFLLLLVFSREKTFVLPAFLVSLIGMGACFLYAGRIGVLEPLRLFGAGGYNYPLLPSPAIFLTLFVYMVAGCVLYSVLRARWFKAGNIDLDRPGFAIQDSMVAPLTIAGCAMLPAALGRCDVLHVAAATPAFVVGVAALWNMPAIRRWWIPLAVVCLVIVPRSMDRIWHFAKIQMVVVSDPALVAQGFKVLQADSQWYVSPSYLTAGELPCDRHYFSPSFMPDPAGKFSTQCLDTGYYLGFTNVMTQGTIDNKVMELRNHATQPLLMENTPLEAQLPRQLATVQSLYYESESFWVPPVRHAPLTYAPIIDYIRQHYVQGPVAAQGRLRIWYPAPR